MDKYYRRRTIVPIEAIVEVAFVLPCVNDRNEDFPSSSASAKHFLVFPPRSQWADIGWDHKILKSYSTASRRRRGRKSRDEAYKEHEAVQLVKAVKMAKAAEAKKEREANAAKAKKEKEDGQKRKAQSAAGRRMLLSRRKKSR